MTSRSPETHAEHSKAVLAVCVPAVGTFLSGGYEPLRHSEHAHLLSKLEKLTLPI